MTKAAADWLKAQRTRAGYPDQAGFAGALGVSRSAVGNWESGRGRPSAEHVPLIASVLSVPQAEVIERFGMKMAGSLPTPTPPWLESVLDRLSRLEQQNDELARLVRIAIGGAALAHQDEE